MKDLGISWVLVYLEIAQAVASGVHPCSAVELHAIHPPGSLKENSPLSRGEARPRNTGEYDDEPRKVMPDARKEAQNHAKKHHLLLLLLVVKYYVYLLGYIVATNGVPTGYQAVRTQGHARARKGT